ncbi:Betaine--homocysteine S-methyltransferase 1 [Amphibalanus amphitrite]|uniref:Betaine--homocysteine S-methyltransferase 1 n=1 Tax=Amphibalanus amphitrite TaxID=1232801 RepID=A0A6A4VWK3_AMPAM|nr:Betaine--homocysteine S-methyltransferase 1 [Amphibalanus amphitrite]
MFDRLKPQKDNKRAHIGLLERLRAGDTIIGDGGMICEMEKRCYVQTGFWTPEVCVTHPQAGRRCASPTLRQSLMQELGIKQSVEEVNRAACRLCREVAEEKGLLFTASLTATPVFEKGGSREEVVDSYRQQLKPIVEERVDFIMCEWLFDIREMELAIGAARETGLPVVACMTIGPLGDRCGVSPEQCALRMARAGADVVGTNCAVGPRVCLQTLHRMRLALQREGLQPFLIGQPIGLRTPEDGRTMIGRPYWPLACEPVTITRFEANLFAREAYEEGIRYIGGCCHFRSYHIRQVVTVSVPRTAAEPGGLVVCSVTVLWTGRAMAEELAKERGGRQPEAASRLGCWGGGLDRFSEPEVQSRVGRQHWAHVAPDLHTLGDQSPAQHFADWKSALKRSVSVDY